MSDLLKICGVWIRTDEKGNVRLSGRYSYDTKIVILPNLKRESDGDPSHFVFLAPNNTNQGNTHQQTGGAGDGATKPRQSKPKQRGRFTGGGWSPSIVDGSGKTKPMPPADSDAPF